MLTMKLLCSSYRMTFKIGRPTHIIAFRPNITILFGSAYNLSSTVVTHKDSSLEHPEKKLQNKRDEFYICERNSRQFLDGMWFYCAFSSFRLFADFVVSPHLVVPRRFRRVDYQKMKARVLPKHTFNLNPKIPFKEPVVDAKANVFNSGDEVNALPQINTSKPLLDFQNSEELKTASEDVKRLFSLEMAPRKEIVDYHIHEVLEKVQRHKLDNKSLEVKIAKMTIHIRSCQERFREQPFNKKLKVTILSLTGKRNRKLRILRMRDMQRFHWLIQVLGITYRPAVLGITERKPMRGKELRRLTEEYCENLRTERITAYHEKLKAQQEEFLKEKEATLEWIREQEKKFGLH